MTNIIRPTVIVVSLQDIFTAEFDRLLDATGTALKDNVRKISQGSGVKVYSAIEGLKALSEGKEINYEGASGPCDFTDIGDIFDCKFRYSQVRKGKLEFLKIA